MKTLLLAAALSVALALPAHAIVLSGTYGGQAEGVDVTGAVIHEIALFRFSVGQLVAFTEMFTFSAGEVDPCVFNPSGNGPFPYSLFNSSFAPVKAPFIVMTALGCPLGSTNNRPESLIIIPEKNGLEFSYLEYTNPYTTNVDGDTPAHFSGHAVIKVVP
jgi:hypothetical protein